jgi:hypothetical protein
LQMPSRRLLPSTSLATVRARPKVGRDCRSFRSSRRVGMHSVDLLGQTHRPRRVPASPRQAPSVRPIAHAVAPTIALHQPRNGESAPQGGSRLPIISLIPPRGHALPTSLGQRPGSRSRFNRPSRAPAAPRQARLWARLRMPSRRIPSSLATVRVRPKVGRDCRSFRSSCRVGMRTRGQKPGSLHAPIDRAERRPPHGKPRREPDC